MFRKLAGSLPVALTLSLLPAVSTAQIWDNGAPNGVNGNEMTQWIQAEDFVLGAATTLTGVRFWGFGCGGAGFSGSVFWQIFSNGAGVPGTSLFSGTAAPTATQRTPNTVGGLCGPSVQYDFGINVALGAGTFWLALHNGPLTSTNRDDFYWETTGTVRGSTGHEDIAPFGTGGWSDNRQEHAFQLFDAPQVVAPEPGTVVLLATGLVGLAGAGHLRRRRRSHNP